LRRAALFLGLGAIGIVLLLLTTFWYLGSSGSGNASVAGMMGQMMGSQYAYGMTTPLPAYMWASIAALFLLIALGIAGAAYYFAFPEIRQTTAPTESPPTAPTESGVAKVDWTVLIRTSNPEEKRVLEVIASHDGKYLQKFIVKESGLSRLKTHRIVSRFAERGIVIVSRSGNTNEVSLAPWLKPETNGGKGSGT
jgi:hypothetical protein